MKKLYGVALSLVAGVILAGSLAGTVLAWHPEGKIKKLVQNVTANGPLTDAEDESKAVAVKPGDTVKYAVKVSNVGRPAANGHNDMVDIVMIDKLPAGVELISDPSKRELKETIARLRPGESKTFEYLVKVTKQENGFVENTACFTGDSEVKDSPQKGCSDANVKVTKPVEPPKEEPKTPAPQPVLPVTGTGGVAGLFVGVSGFGYLAHRFLTRKR